jgi:hypothetical protein
MNATRREYGLICPAISSPAWAARRRIIFQASGWPIRFPVRVMNSGPVQQPSR